MKLVDLHKSDSAIIHIMYDSIIKNALDKRKDILETAAKTTQYLAGISDYTQIIMKIEDAFGPCRLLIISEESSIILTSHRIDPELPDTILEQSSGYKYLIVVEAPNGKSRKYSIIIDRGTPEKLNQLKPEHLETIINPMIRRHIQAKENALIKFVNDYATGVIECEKNMYMPLVRPDYSEFISSVIEQSSDP